MRNCFLSADCGNAPGQKALKQMEECKKQIDILEFKETFYQNLIKNNLKDTWNPMNQIELENTAV